MKDKFIAILMIALAATACSGDNNDPDDGGKPSGPQILTSAQISFVTNLSGTGTLSCSKDVMSSLITANPGCALFFIDNVGDSFLPSVQSLSMTSSAKWNAFALNEMGANGARGGFFFFKQPTRFVKTHISDALYATGLSTTLSGKVTKTNGEGVIESEKDVNIDVAFYTSRIETEAQLNDFCANPGLMSAIKSENKAFMASGLVKSDLFGKLQTAVGSLDSAYKVSEAAKGDQYTLYFIANPKNWVLNRTDKHILASGCDEYRLDIGWK